MRALDHTAGDTGTFHGQIVAEDHAVETHLLSQYGEPFFREACRMSVELGVDHMRGHHAR